MGFYFIKLTNYGMESTLYGIFPFVGEVSEISLVRCAHSFSFRYLTNSCENPVCARFPWSNLYLFHFTLGKRLLFFFALLEMTTESINRVERQLHEKLKNNQKGRAKGSKRTAGVPSEEKSWHTKPEWLRWCQDVLGMLFNWYLSRKIVIAWY